VLASVPDYLAAVQDWNRNRWSSPDCYPDNRGTHHVRGQVPTGLRFYSRVSSTLAPIKYLSFDRIMVWSICKLFSFSRSFTFGIQICNTTEVG
jgi:hypothetical protein